MKFIIATIIFALDVWAIASIINSNESNGTKLIWILLVALLPVVGLIIASKRPCTARLFFYTVYNKGVSN